MTVTRSGTSRGKCNREVGLRGVAYHSCRRPFSTLGTATASTASHGMLSHAATRCAIALLLQYIILGSAVPFCATMIWRHTLDNPCSGRTAGSNPACAHAPRGLLHVLHHYNYPQVRTSSATSLAIASCTHDSSLACSPRLWHMILTACDCLILSTTQAARPWWSRSRSRV